MHAPEKIQINNFQTPSIMRKNQFSLFYEEMRNNGTLTAKWRTNLESMICKETCHFIQSNEKLVCGSDE